MLNFVLRRIQTVIIPIKIVMLLLGSATLVFLVINTAPGLGNVLLFSLALFVVLSLFLSFYLTANRSLLAALTISFLLFLKAVGLLNLVNLILFGLFLGLLSLYVYKRWYNVSMSKERWEKVPYAGMGLAFVAILAAVAFPEFSVPLALVGGGTGLGIVAIGCVGYARSRNEPNNTSGV